MKKRKCFMLVASALMLTSCANYTASPLCYPSVEYVRSVSKSEITVVSKAFSEKDCLDFLGRDVIAEGYQPVQIYIENNSNDAYLFSLNRISMPVAKYQEVAEKVHTSTFGRVVGYSLGSLFFLPLIIPAFVDGFCSADSNRKLNEDFSVKAAKDQLIAAHSRFNGIIFVPVNGYADFFSITFVDAKTQDPKVVDVLAFR